MTPVMKKSLNLKTKFNKNKCLMLLRVLHNKIINLLLLNNE